MKKLSLYIIMMLIFILAACGGSPVPEVEEEAAASDQNFDAADSGEASGQNEASETAVTTAEEIDLLTLGNPLEVREVDYFKGAPEPTFTIIEYGDFQ